MRRGMQGLALQVQEQLKRDPHAGAPCCNRQGIVTSTVIAANYLLHDWTRIQ
jgi:hypothetical protein